MIRVASRRRIALRASLILLVAPALALAAVVDMAFDPQGRFEHSMTIAPGKFVEICGKLQQGDRVAWSFESQAGVDFNIHYHVGEKVEYPERRAAVSQLAGELLVTSTQDYCWMWKSGAAAPVAMKVQLHRRSLR